MNSVSIVCFLDRVSSFTVRLLFWLITLFDRRKLRCGRASLLPSVVSSARIFASMGGLSDSISCHLQFFLPGKVI